MAKRKSDVIQGEMLEMSKKFDELKQIQQTAEEEEKQKIEQLYQSIKQIAENGEMFCGLIITKADIVNMMKLMLETGENLHIEFKLYYKE